MLSPVSRLSIVVFSSSHEDTLVSFSSNNSFITVNTVNSGQSNKFISNKGRESEVATLSLILLNDVRQRGLKRPKQFITVTQVSLASCRVCQVVFLLTFCIYQLTSTSSTFA